MFLNSLMLVGIAAAVVPLVLHLLSRARYKDIDWGGMMFLEGADTQRRQSARFTQILLLLLRSLVIALLALAMARPVVKGKWVGQESSGRVTAALVLDCSASMSFDENGRTRFQMAQAAARQIIRGLRPGDRVSLILMGVQRNAVDLEPTGDLRAVEAKIDEAKQAPVIQVVDQAVPPDLRSWPKRRLFVVFGAAIALILSSTLSFFLENARLSTK